MSFFSTTSLYHSTSNHLPVVSLDTSNRLIAATVDLKDQVNELNFGSPTEYVYNPLDYAWPAHEQYLRMATATPTEIVFLGMNPGPVWNGSDRGSLW